MNKFDKCYRELSRLTTFEDRFEYLKIGGTVGYETFGYDRYLNQALYSCKEWKTVRRDVFVRDNGCDLGIEGREIYDRYLIHHMIPITVDDILNREPWVFDPNYLITTTHSTHNAIHYGDISLIPKGPIVRTRNDTVPWKN